MSYLPLVLGHAGAGVSGPTPENSLAGAAQSLREGADGIEIDVQLSADGEPVLMHDATVERMTGARGRVRALTLAQLQQARLANGEGVPTLSALLQQVAGRMTVMCELKVDRDDPVEAAGKGEFVVAVLRVIAAHEAHAWTAIHSFDGGGAAGRAAGVCRAHRAQPGRGRHAAHARCVAAAARPGDLRAARLHNARTGAAGETAAGDPLVLEPEPRGRLGAAARCRRGRDHDRPSGGTAGVHRGAWLTRGSAVPKVWARLQTNQLVCFCPGGLRSGQVVCRNRHTRHTSPGATT
jgi:hypothetical protein